MTTVLADRVAAAREIAATSPDSAGSRFGFGLVRAARCQLVLDVGDRRMLDLAEVTQGGAGIHLLFGDGQLGTAARGEGEEPVDEGVEAVAEADQVHQMQRQPAEPREIALGLELLLGSGMGTCITALKREMVAIDPLS